MSDFDIVLYGATGFTGRQAAHYLAAHAPDGLRWAVAGRNADRVRAVCEEVGAAEGIVADSGRPETVDAMVRRARVVATTAGPFSRYGTPVVDACVTHRADYVDITGETPWVRELIDAYHERAAGAGSRIVPCCGFDSVPSDLGALMVVDHLRREHGEATRSVSASFRARGGLNGGTLATMLTLAEQGSLRRAASDPFLLNPPGRGGAGERPRDRRSVEFDPDRGAWLAPFFMAPINTRVVRRSAALAADYGEPYGDSFSYDEAIETSRRGKARAVAAGTAAAFKLAELRLGRAALAKLGPEPGQGPSERTMDEGFFRTRFVGTSEHGRKVVATLAAQGDPGNRVTVPILCEAALLLATSRDELPGGHERGGILTPATALGLPLLERLRGAGFEASVSPL